jgi:hypothetical protein
MLNQVVRVVTAVLQRANNISMSMGERRSAHKISIVKLRGNSIECLVPFSTESVIFCLLSKNIKTVILSAVLCLRRTWPLTLGESV